MMRQVKQANIFCMCLMEQFFAITVFLENAASKIHDRMLALHKWPEFHNRHSTCCGGSRRQLNTNMGKDKCPAFSCSG